MSEIFKGARLGMANFEKRKHPRLDINLPVAYLKSDDRWHSPGSTRNLSNGGLLLHVFDDIDIGEELKIAIFIKPELNPIEMKGRVVWKDICFGREEYRVGVHFLDITQEHLERLKEFLNDKISKESSQPQIPSQIIPPVEVKNDWAF